MNTEAIRGAAEVICAAEKKSTVPVTLAIALEAAGWLNTPETADELRSLRARVAELEAAATKVAEFCAQRAEYVANLRNANPNADHDYYRWSGHAAARRQLSQRLDLPVGWPTDDVPVATPAPAEDPHDSPLHHDYRVGHDLPEMPHA